MNVNKAKQFFLNNKLVVSVAIFIAIACYGFEIMNFNLSIDEELMLYQGIEGYPHTEYISMGRYGVTLIKMFLQSWPFTPYISTFLAITILTLTAILWCFILEEISGENQNTIKKIVLVALFISYPINAHYLSFATYNFEVSIGWMIVTLATYYIVKYLLLVDKKKNLIIGIILLNCKMKLN